VAQAKTEETKKTRQMIENQDKENQENAWNSSVTLSKTMQGINVKISVS